jgi:ribosome-associated protein
MIKVQPPFHEFTFETTRSSGAGGQHVNKTDSAVILRWTPATTQVFSDEDRDKILRFLWNQLTRDGELMIKSSDQRSQKQNKDTCVEKWIFLIQKALKPRIKRVATKPTRSSQRKRVDTKKRHSEIKKLRGKVEAE